MQKINELRTVVIKHAIDDQRFESLLSAILMKIETETFSQLEKDPYLQKISLSISLKEILKTCQISCDVDSEYFTNFFEPKILDDLQHRLPAYNYTLLRASFSNNSLQLKLVLFSTSEQEKKCLLQNEKQNGSSQFTYLSLSVIFIAIAVYSYLFSRILIGIAFSLLFLFFLSILLSEVNCEKTADKIYKANKIS